MSTDNTRHIVVKTLLNADEFQEFEKRCKADDLSQSRAIRDLLKKWLHRSAPDRQKERPRLGQKMALSFPSRRGGAPIPLRL